MPAIRSGTVPVVGSGRMIQFCDVRKRFGDHVVLDGFTLDIPDGQTTVIIGASGSGKSVALKHIVGLLTPDFGQVLVDGQDIEEMDRAELMDLRAKTGYVFQSAALFDSLTVEENILMGLNRRGLDRATIQERVAWSLDMVELGVSADSMPSELSGGMQKRVGIARAIAVHPEYILYDEPTTGLDPVTAGVMNDLIAHIREEMGTASVVVTHDMRTAFSVGDRIAMLHQGRILLVDTADGFRQTTDPIARAFIEGRASGLDLSNLMTQQWQVPSTGAPGGSAT
jgi:phospholipid/cholesterol/gamma-HCH transport system ATP-binding protein